MDRELYYYFRDNQYRPLVTVCLLQDGDEISRGVAICSLKDIPRKKTGRHIAKGRALQALEHKSLGCMIERSDALHILNTIVEAHTEITHQSEHDPELTAFERQLLYKSLVWKCMPISGWQTATIPISEGREAAHG